MGPTKRPAQELDGDSGTGKGKSRVGFKDATALSVALSPFVNQRFFTTYSTNRAMKALDKKKLQSKPTCHTIEQFSGVCFCHLSFCKLTRRCAS